MNRRNTHLQAATGWTSIDAALDWGNGKIYFFKDNQYLAYDKATEMVLPGYPASIGSAWRGVGFTRIDAAVLWPGGRYAYFFSGDEYCRYNIAADRVDPGFERLKIKDHWKGIPFPKLDGALVWVDRKSVYFFSGDEYCRYNVTADKVDPGYERLKIKDNWKGLFPSRVQAPLLWGESDAKVFFFSGTQYARYDVRLERVDPNYPASVTSGWDFRAVPALAAGTTKDMRYVKHARARNQNSPYVWNPMPDGRPTPGPVRRAIYSPLDDQPLLVYTINKAPRDSDGCSIVNYLKDPGTKAHAEIFNDACLAHDANYEAPWTEIGWKDGRLLCESLLLHDMKRVVDSSKMNEARRGAARIVANTWYNFLEAGVTKSSLGIVKDEPFDVAQRLNRQEGYAFTDIRKGGLLSVWNKDGAFVMGVDVTYTSATGKKITFSEKQPITKTIVVPISIGARGITLSCYAVAGREIFKRSFSSPAVMRVVVGGTTLFPTVKENP